MGVSGLKSTQIGSRQQLLQRVLWGLCICLGCLGLYLWQPLLLQQADRTVYDIFLRQRPLPAVSPAPVIVDIDEASLQELGQWPWSRNLLAQLLTILTRDGAAAIGLDILFPEADNTSPLTLQKQLKKNFSVDLGFVGLPKNLYDNDILMADALRRTPSVLGMYVQFTGRKETRIPDFPYMEGVMERQPQGAPPVRDRLLRGQGITLPLPLLREAAPCGSINVMPDNDGILRRVPMISLVGDRIVPFLALRTLMRALNVNNLHLVGGKDGLMAVRVGRYTVPVTPEGLFPVPFVGGRGVYPYYSAKDVLAGRVPAENIQGRVVFVGTSAPGLADIRTTPFEAIYPGVETMATVVDSILSSHYINVPSWTPGAQVVCIVGFGFLVVLVFSLASATVYLPLFALLATGTVYASWMLFLRQIYFSPVYALLTICALLVSLLSVRFWQETQGRRALRKAFIRYVPPAMVTRISDKGEAVLAGEERNVALLFTDIRGFTGLSESLRPQQVVGLLNDYFTPLTRIVHSYNGTVDKLIGDSLMAFWNAPLDLPQYELYAVNSALAMQKALNALNTTLADTLGLTLSMGIGIHAGSAFVGNMGTEEFLDYTCVGDTVNVASRLETQCGIYNAPILVSTAVADRCREYAPQAKLPVPYFLAVDVVRVKGKSRPVEICIPLDAAEAESRREEFDAFVAARDLYMKGDFAAAQQAFTRLYRVCPSMHVYTLFAARSKTLHQAPPSTWTGVWTYE